ncbi:glycosyltransferase [Foetidibacter luteolus]|uniref:glycosyltransferase n=1 Tax=Foetidibacter luteolus TaxID=2608880 RepID=UPI00129B29C9|nr:glycosyltransferase [Foetidibacter luteolus]
MNHSPTNLISVVITCYNHGNYLEEALNSILQQGYTNYEIIVVDDGSTDFTKVIAQAYSQVKYVWQQNQGLGAARNTGVRESSGDYLVFLDADDWFYPDAFQLQMDAFANNPVVAAVAGGHYKVNEEGEIIEEDENIPRHQDHYLDLLQGNFIGMHAAVMYRRSVFNTFQYDTTLRAAEDYDLYLKLTRRFPIYMHREKIAAYRIHGNNMSRNITMMLQHVLTVLRRQEPELQSLEEKNAYAKGIKNWNEYYTDVLVKNKLYYLNRRHYLRPLLTNDELQVLKLNQPGIISKMQALNARNRLRRDIKKVVTPLKKILGKTPKEVAQGAIDWGSFKRIKPISNDFGFDRGGPIDRYYIEAFLHDHQADIKGCVMEIGDNAYTKAYGGEKVTVSEVLHLHPNFPGATLAGDLSKADEIPIADNYFDCIVLTQTLHFIYDFNRALQQCYRILKPGGVLLLTAPGITQIDAGKWGENWLWAFTERGMTMAMQTNFSADAAIKTYGNVFSATAFLWGLGLGEVPHGEYLDHVDPCYQVIIAVRAVKPGGQNGTGLF